MLQPSPRANAPANLHVLYGTDCISNVNVMWPSHCMLSMTVLRGASWHKETSVSAVRWGERHSPPGLLFYVFFPRLTLVRQSPLYPPLDVFPKLVLLLIQLALENQTKHDTALHYLAWWCHYVMNITLTLWTLWPHLPSICQRLVRCKQVCLCEPACVCANLWHFLEIE